MAERAPSLGHRPPLDGVRALAALSVVAFHVFFGATGSLAGVAKRTRPGFLGVDVFFALSGFLITSLLLGEFGRRGRIRYARFYSRRALRLLPALVAVLAFGTLYVLVFPHRPESVRYAENAISSLFYVNNWVVVSHNGPPVGLLTHTWSLSIEEQYYLVWPALLAALLYFGRRQAAVATGLLVAASVGLTVILHEGGASFWRLYYGSDTHAATVLVGALAAILFANGWLPSGPRAQIMWRAITAIAVVWVLWVFGTGQTTWADGVLGLPYVTALLTAAVILAVVVDADGPAARGLSWRPLVAVGKVSYGLYLWHVIVVEVITPDRVHSQITRIVLQLLVSAAVTVVTWYLIEQPFLRIKDRLGRKATPIASAQNQ